MNEERIVRFEMRKMGSGEEVTAFGQVHPSDGRVKLHAEHLGGRSFEMVKASSYDFDGFARDFGDHRPRQMRNVGFDLEQGHIFMNVDRDRFEFREPKLAAYNGRAVLTGKVEGHDVRFRFTFDGKEVTARIQDDKPIRSFDAYKGQLFLHHSGDYRGDSGNLEAGVVARLACKAYELPGGDSIRFNMWRPTIERKSGMRFETGKLYDISGEVKGIEFTVAHRPMEGQHIMAFITGEKVKELTPGEKYDVTITSVAERTVFPVLDYKQGQKLRFTKRDLESFGINTHVKGGSDDNVIEFHLRNLLKPTESATKVFGEIMPGMRHTILNMRNHASEVRAYEVIYAGTFDQQSLATKFNECRLEQFQNVKLRAEGPKLAIEVDGNVFPADRTRLRARNLEVVLDAHIPPIKREIRFWFDGSSVTPKFGDSWKITRFRGFESGFRITYEPSKLGIATTWFGARHSPPQKLELFPERLNEMADKFDIVRKPPGREGRHLFDANNSLYSYIRSRLEKAPDSRAFRREKGRMAEEFSSGVLSRVGWKEIRRHPSVERPVGDGCNKPGPDSLQMFLETGEKYLFEFKWWKNPVIAARRAIEQVETRYRHDWNSFREVQGAYIGILNWDLEGTSGSLDVKKVWSR